MFGDIAFVFVEVLLVTLIIHKLLGEREKRARLDKLNMVIGSFFSEVGTKLLTYFSDFDPNLDSIRKELIVSEDWSDQEFARINHKLRNYRYEVKIHEIVLEHLTNFLVEKRGFGARVSRQNFSVPFIRRLICFIFDSPNAVVIGKPPKRMNFRANCGTWAKVGSRSRGSETDLARPGRSCLLCVALPSRRRRLRRLGSW